MVIINPSRIKTFKDKIDRLLAIYGTFESLKEAARTYSGGAPNHKKELKKVKRWMKQLELLQQPNSTSNPNEGTNETSNNVPYCHNCHRVQTVDDDSTTNHQYRLDLQERISDTLPKGTRKFKNVVASTRYVQTYTLCHQCNCHLQEVANNPNYNSFAYTWPGFVWYLLTDNSILEHYQSEFLWKLIPHQWRAWWLPSLKAKYPRLYAAITIELPKPIIIDRTDDLKEWNSTLSENVLPNIAKCCNKHLLPTVLCPWGCTEYLHKHGCIDLCSVIQKCLPKVQLCTTTRENFKKISTSRDDYIRLQSSDYEEWLLNPDWKVMPTIVIDIEKGPMSLTCKDHNKGNAKYMLHTCRQPDHIIPAMRPDQLAPCVNRPRTVKPVKKSKFSTTYQMHEQKGSFNGIDTCSVTFFGKFDFQSTLSAVSDARALSQRPDINSHLTTLVKEKIISSDTASSRIAEAELISRTIDYEPYYNASTFVPLEKALSMQQENAQPRFAKVPTSRGGTANEAITFRVGWPRNIYPCQTLNDHGTHPHLPPKFGTKQPRPFDKFHLSKIWSLSATLLTVEYIWTTAVSFQTYDRESWHGWLLAYLSKNSLSHISFYRDSLDPFKVNQISSSKAIATKLSQLIMNPDDMTCPKSLQELFNTFEGLLCLDGNQFQTTTTLENFVEYECDLSNCKGIIVENYVRENENVPSQICNENNEIYELVHISSVSLENNNTWDGKVCMRHGGIHSKWWYATRKSNVYVKRDHHIQITDDEVYCLVYIKIISPNLEKASQQLMSHIGGQTSVQCLYHKMPLILSTFRKGKCFCGKREYYRCPDFNCSMKCCKKCLENVNADSDITYVHKNGMTNDSNHMQTNSDTDESDSDFDYGDRSCSGDSLETHESVGHEVDLETERLFYNSDSDQSSSVSILDDYQLSEVGDDTSYSPLNRDDFEDYVTSAEAPDFNIITETYNEESSNEEETVLPATDAGIYPFEVTEADESTTALQDLIVTGNVLLNQCGTLLTRNNHQIKGSSRGKLLMQRICATTIGKSVPLLQPEASLFPSIFWKMVPNDGVISGAIPTPLLSERCGHYGFQSLPQHVRSRLTTAFCTTSTDPHYTTHEYDLLTNLSATHLDTRIAMNRGLTAGSDTLGGLGVRGGNDSSGAALLGSIDSNQMVKNLCASQKLHPSSFFCTFTCAQARHFGTKNIKLWIDGFEWKSHFQGYEDLSDSDKREVDLGIQQAAAVLLLRNWQETCKIFLDYLKDSPTSPFRHTGSMFARNEYQKDAGNLSHIHMLIEVKWEEMTVEEKNFVDNLIRTSHLDICPDEEAEEYMRQGIFHNVEEQRSTQEYGKRVLRHNCSQRCLERTGPGPNDFRCRFSNNLRDNPDPKKEYFLPLPNSLPVPVKEKLIELQLIDGIEVNDLNYETPFECKDDFFHPTRHIPPTNPNEDVNMSPVDSYTFSICQSMQNIQLIKGTGGCNKYVCKYVGKIDEQNYVVVKANPKDSGQLITQSNFLHNTKVTGSKLNEDLARQRSKDKDKPVGRKISHMEMAHVMLKYPEVYTDLRFVNVPTYPIAFRKSMGICAKRNPVPKDPSDSNNSNTGYGDTEDAASTHPFMLITRSEAMLEIWRNHTNIESTLIRDLYTTKHPIDAITRFSVRPPELRKLFNSPAEYFRWFSFSKKATKDDFAISFVTSDIRYSAFIDGIQFLVKIRANAVKEILEYFEVLNNSNEDLLPEVETMISTINEMFNSSNRLSDNGETEYYKHVEENIIDSSSTGLLPICVYSQVRPTGGINFILHLMLSMGRFDTEIEMTVNDSLQKCLRKAKLIGESDNIDDLKDYSNALLLRYITEQLKYFSNSRRLIIHWIEVAASVLESVIIHDEIPVTEMPPVQLTSILASREEAATKFLAETKEKLTKAVFKEVGDFSTQGSFPTVDDVMNASKSSPYEWDPVACHKKNPIQSMESYEEQQLAIKLTTRAIDRYTSFSSNHLCTKNIGIRGFPGGGKTWCSMYCILYALSKGLNCLATAVMAKRATQLGGTHWHKFFCIPVEKRLSPHRMAELAINKLTYNKVRHNAVLTLDVILADEFGQLSAEFISAIDIILRNVRNSNTIFGGVLIIGTLDHTQIQPWEGRPFLTSPQIIPTFEMVNLCHSIRTNNESSQRIQTIARLNYRNFKDDPSLIDEFIDLASRTFTFVDNWENEHIVPSTFRVYSKRVPAVDAAKEFMENVMRNVTNTHDLIIRKSLDTQKARYTTSDWRQASQDISNKLEEKIKPPGKLLFFKGAVYECTYNHKEGLFNQSQIALLYDMPTQESLDSWKSVKVLIAPPALKDVEFDMNLSKQHYTESGFKEVDIETCPERPISISHNLQAQRKQYGLKHRVTGTIHSAMGDTYESMATMISTTDKNFSLWDKGQLIVIISRTRDPSRTVFVGNKAETLDAFRQLLLKRTQWTDFMEHILDVITINSCEGEARITAVPEEYPFQISAIELPQCQTGFVYMLSSLRRRDYTYIGTSNCIRTRIVEHNSGYGSRSTEDYRLRPFAMMAYICGFGCDRPLMYSIEAKWKRRRDQLRREGNDDPRDWAKCGEDVIRAETNNIFGDTQSTLKLVLLFR